jgi:TolB-like protein/Tfp pilus assembly protein PilF
MSNPIRFGCFEVDLPSGQLHKHGVRINLRDKSFQVLASLLEHPGEVVTREELQRRLWHDDVFVDFENNLNTAVARLREALCDSADHPRFIETLPKRGYRFLAPVSKEVAVPQQARASRPKLVVLPFVNLSGDPAQEYFSDAMTDEIITALASVAPQQFAVIARTTAMHYKGSHKDVARIGRELEVDYLVEGAVRRTEERVAINVQLIQVSDQTYLFAKKYDAQMRDIFSLHKYIAQAIAGRTPRVAENLLSSVVASGRARKPTEDLAAYNEYIQGRLTTLGAESFAAARQHLENAIARDPGFAQAHDALAELYWQLGYLGFMSPRKAFSAGIVHALHALEMDNTRAETHALLAQFHKTIEYNWPEVHREMALALRLDPNSPLVRMRYAVSELMPHGRMDEAVAEIERALEFDPLSMWARLWLCVMLVLGRRFERGLEESRKLLDFDPTSGLGHFVIGLFYRYQKKFEEAISAHRKAVELSGLPGALGWLGLTLASSGRTAEARDVLRQLHAVGAQGYVPPTSIAWIHLGLGEVDTAFEWLNRAVEECDQFMLPIKTYAFFDPIRTDPRFAALLRKMNLEP